MAFENRPRAQDGEVFKFTNVGDTLTGRYLGSADFVGDYGPTKKHAFETETGIKVVFGSKDLNDQLLGEKPGNYLQITFDSLKKMKKGNPMKLFNVAIDRQKSRETESIYANETAVAEEECGDLPDDETPLDEVATGVAKSAPAARAQSAASRAEIEAMVKNNRRAG